ncbi:hypothetical protein ACEPAI_5541 [Sanghuangporus weigelae]
MHFLLTLSTITTTTSSLHCLAVLQRADARALFRFAHVRSSLYWCPRLQDSLTVLSRYFPYSIGVELDPLSSHQHGSLNYLKIDRSEAQRASSERAQ